MAPRRLGGRVLKLGMQGPDVAALQKLLIDMGFDPGPPNGDFGWLTYEALREFQRAMRLQVDGVAGKQVFALLKDGNRLPSRRVHIVAPGETPSRILRRYGLRREALYAYNSSRSLKHLYEGQELILPERLVIGYLGNGERGLKSLLWHHRFLSGVAGLWLHLGERQELVGSIPKSVVEAARERGLHLLPVLTNLGNGGYEGRLFRRAIGPRGSRQRLIGQLRKALEGVDGLILDFRDLALGDVSSIASLLDGLRPLRRQMLLFLTLAAREVGRPWRGMLGDDYWALAQKVDGVILRFDDELKAPSRCGPIIDYKECREVLSRVLEVVPGWKVILRLPAYGWQWTGRPVKRFGLWSTLAWEKPEPVAYYQAVRLAQEHQASFTDDGSRVDYVQENPRRLWIETVRAISEKASLVNKYNLAGVAVFALGLEDPRIWKEIGANYLIRKTGNNWQDCY